jgi:hypothetical protein
MNCAHNGPYTLTIKGQELTIHEWAMKTGVPYGTLKYRVQAGWPEEYLFMPPKSIRPPSYGEAPRVTMRLPKTAYTREELYVLYRYFAGQPNEAEMLADFACLPEGEIGPLLEEFRARRRREFKK